MTTFVVTTSTDLANGDVSENDLSLREAIELANASPGVDRITFADGIDYLALNDKLPTISDDLRLVGGGDVVLDANADGDFDPATTAEAGNRRGLDIRGDDIAVSIDGLTITGGRIANGAGIRSGREVDLSVVDSRISGNVGHGGYYDAFGGGIKAGGDLTLVGCRVEDNVGLNTAGGGIAVFGEARILRSTVRNNEADSGGGGIWAAGGLTLRHSRVIGNEDGDDYGGAGGGILARGAVVLVDSRVIGNAAFSGYFASGGGIFASEVTARDSVIAENVAGGARGGYGGGISATRVRLLQSEVSGNTARGGTTAYGGGIDAGSVELVKSSVFGNVADSFIAAGGGIFVDFIGIEEGVVARASTIASNTVRTEYHEYSGGGGIFGGHPEVRIALNGVTLTGNEVIGDGPGGAIVSSGEILLRNSLVVGNAADGGHHAVLGRATLRSSLVANDGRDTFESTERIAPGIFAGLFGDNGGLTPTVALRFDRDNPAFDGADPENSTPTDQRGVARDAHPDIGAFEATRRVGVTLTGTPRSDVLQGTDARDTLDGREGDDLLRGLDGRDELRGGADDDTVRGNRGKDVVDGGGGSDVIFGGRGDDLLRGGTGPDRFVLFERFGVDVIEDFDARPANGQDRIDMRHLGISSGTFEERVTITDLGGATLVAVEDAGAILCRGVDGEGANAITVEDFLLLP